jgi:hypothetical protein
MRLLDRYLEGRHVQVWTELREIRELADTLEPF